MRPQVNDIILVKKKEEWINYLFDIGYTWTNNSKSETHWLDRPIIPNKLNCNINDLFV